MGLFSFLKNAGSKLFSKKEEERESTTTDGIEEEVAPELKVNLLRGVVDGLNIDIEDLELTVDGETVNVNGTVKSQSDREKIILALGNVAGVSAVNERLEVAIGDKFYEVQKGDYLSKIAKEFYGDPMKYPMIFEANKPMLKDPELIYPGQVLRIPPLANA